MAYSGGDIVKVNGYIVHVHPGKGYSTHYRHYTMRRDESREERLAELWAWERAKHRVVDGLPFVWVTYHEDVDADYHRIGKFKSRKS